MVSGSSLGVGHDQHECRDLVAEADGCRTIVVVAVVTATLLAVVIIGGVRPAVAIALLGLPVCLAFWFHAIRPCLSCFLDDNNTVFF